MNFSMLGPFETPDSGGNFAPFCVRIAEHCVAHFAAHWALGPLPFRELPAPATIAGTWSRRHFGGYLGGKFWLVSDKLASLKPLKMCAYRHSNLNLYEDPLPGIGNEPGFATRGSGSRILISGFRPGCGFGSGFRVPEKTRNFSELSFRFETKNKKRLTVSRS